MTARNYTNNAQAQTLASGINSSDTTLIVGNTTSFPATPFTLVLERTRNTQEVVLCTAKPSSTTFTVTRGYDGTTAVAHLSGSSVEHTVASLDYAEANAHNNSAHFSATFNAKGDLLTATAAATPAILAVGADGNSLVPEASAATGLRYEKSRGTVVCTSTTRPTLGLFEGVRIYETDSKLFYLYSGSMWIPEPGQLLGSSVSTTTSGFGLNITTRLTLNFTMPTLAAGRKVEIVGSCFYVALQTLFSGQLFSLFSLAKSSGTLMAQTLMHNWNNGNVLELGAIPVRALIDNTDIAAGATTVYYQHNVMGYTFTGGTAQNHRMVADANNQATLRAVII